MVKGRELQTPVGFGDTPFEKGALRFFAASRLRVR